MPRLNCLLSQCLKQPLLRDSALSKHTDSMICRVRFNIFFLHGKLREVWEVQLSDVNSTFTSNMSVCAVNPQQGHRSIQMIKYQKIRFIWISEIHFSCTSLIKSYPVEFLTASIARRGVFFTNGSPFVKRKHMHEHAGGAIHILVLTLVRPSTVGDGNGEKSSNVGTV